MNKRIISIAVLAIGTTAVIGASTIPGPGLTASPAPITGITNSTEALLNSGALARTGYSQAVGGCLSAAGFNYTPASEHTGVDLNGAMGISRLDLATAHNSGYSSVQPKGPHEAAPETSEAELFATPAFLKALNGTEATRETVKVGTMGTFLGGCKLEAARTIYGNTANYGLATAAAMNILAPASHSAAEDPGVVDAVKDWKDCMAETPYSAFEGPWQAVNTGTAAGGQEEREIAVTDAICRDHTKLHATLDTILDRYVTTLVQQQDSQFQHIADILKSAAANSAKLTAPKTS